MHIVLFTLNPTTLWFLRPCEYDSEDTVLSVFLYYIWLCIHIRPRMFLQCQVLTPLEPLDYIVVAFLPGLTEVSIIKPLNFHFICCCHLLDEEAACLISCGNGRGWR